MNYLFIFFIATMIKAKLFLVNVKEGRFYKFDKLNVVMGSKNIGAIFDEEYSTVRQS